MITAADIRNTLRREGINPISVDDRDPADPRLIRVYLLRGEGVEDAVRVIRGLPGVTAADAVPQTGGSIVHVLVNPD
jgi:hypothetical protein